MPTTRLRVLLGATLLLLTSGCSSRTHPVHGTVVFKGTEAPAKELAGYLITFESADPPVGATGEVQEDGSFKMTTYKQNDGAVPGKHKVAITPDYDSLSGDRKPWRIDPRYGDFATSGLEMTVVPGHNSVKFEVERRSR